MHDSLATTSKGHMIDNPDQVERLIARLRQCLPLFATVTPEVAAIIRERSPAAADPRRRYRISRVDYAGDEGGIVCKVELGPEVGDALYSPQLRICVSVMRNRLLARSRDTKSIGSSACGVSAKEARPDGISCDKSQREIVDTRGDGDHGARSASTS
jgi:hypothetical protein